jgi:NAD(P)-dependent dehydrogenase (short-subunit alcohol dehydrogenase family)
MGDAWFFAGKTALVTGSASGMGRAVTTQLLRAGCRVVGLDITDQDDGPSHQFQPVRVDLADTGGLSRVLDGWSGQLDFVVNAAGVSPLRETKERVLAVDWEAPRRICDWAVTRLEEPGAIVNIASVAGIYETFDAQAAALMSGDDSTIPDAGIAYAVAKRAVIIRTMQLAGTHAARRIRVNSVSPHAAATPMHYAIKRDEPEMYARANMTATWGRWSSADEQADVILFLLGPRSSYVSGVNIVVDGGWWAAAQTTDPSLRQFH